MLEPEGEQQTPVSDDAGSHASAPRGTGNHQTRHGLPILCPLHSTTGRHGVNSSFAGYAGGKSGDRGRKQFNYRWKAQYGGLEVNQLRRLRLVEEENRKLKQIVADLTLDNHALKDITAKNW
jgi:hypothetical protein